LFDNRFMTLDSEGSYSGSKQKRHVHPEYDSWTLVTRPPEKDGRHPVINRWTLEPVLLLLSSFGIGAIVVFAAIFYVSLGAAGVVVAGGLLLGVLIVLILGAARRRPSSQMRRDQSH
jgi:Flp pilus assembly protein TadB